MADEEPTGEYFEQVVDFDEDDLYRGADVSWVGVPGAMMKVPRDMVVSMPGNPFNPGHLAFLTGLARQGAIFEAPAARIHRLHEEHVEESQKAFEDDPTFEAGSGMSRPWEEEDVGEHYAVLLDGNHRAFAAICAGEPYIWVIVGPSYRDDVQGHLE